MSLPAKIKYGKKDDARQFIQRYVWKRSFAGYPTPNPQETWIPIQTKFIYIETNYPFQYRLNHESTEPLYAVNGTCIDHNVDGLQILVPVPIWLPAIDADLEYTVEIIFWYSDHPFRPFTFENSMPMVGRIDKAVESTPEPPLVNWYDYFIDVLHCRKVRLLNLYLYSDMASATVQILLRTQNQLTGAFTNWDYIDQLPLGALNDFRLFPANNLWQVMPNFLLNRVEERIVYIVIRLFNNEQYPAHTHYTGLVNWSVGD